MTEIFRTTVTDAGEQAGAFIADGLFVTFGQGVPDSLKDFCFIIEMNPVEQPLAVGQNLLVDGVSYPITAVGEAAHKNLEGLGHVTVNVTGGDTAGLAGAIHIDCAGNPPQLQVGSVLTIES
ncbi:MAG TPA: PTS glucitol/sorbitol transporter subunit IIA [Candidatus Luteococcus avicola]|nr:PTS glucitol/sorbitol transporter subunit IIA [Candidatus Luteococcus avicola]